MSFCPSCKAEYIKSVNSCPDCGESLVEHLPHSAKLQEMNWIPLHSVPGKAYAEMVTEIFDKEEIPNYTKSDAVSTAYLTGGAGSIGGTSVIFVPEEHQSRAEEILTQLLDGI
ncbi:MAG: DUF2007 domain-containing protein [Candidatus Marinimicrobia bacterium]|nr:DUF2007 domain-containing protein [Candidatus Neomarinimicrobiota bacterium]